MGRRETSAKTRQIADPNNSGRQDRWTVREKVRGKNRGGNRATTNREPRAKAGTCTRNKRGGERHWVDRTLQPPPSGREARAGRGRAKDGRVLTASHFAKSGKTRYTGHTWQAGGHPVGDRGRAVGPEGDGGFDSKRGAGKHQRKPDRLRTRTTAGERRVRMGQCSFQTQIGRLDSI